VIEANLFLQLLMGLLAYPPGLDGTGQLPERRVGGQIAKVVFALGSGAMLADQPDLFAGKRLLAEVTDALRRAVWVGCRPKAEAASGT
jgi:hypothetical protein